MSLKMKTTEQINRTRTEMLKAKPRSRRRLELEMWLRDLIVKQLRFENRIVSRDNAQHELCG